MIVVMSRLGWPLRSCSAGFRVPDRLKKRAININFSNFINDVKGDLYLKMFPSKLPFRGDACSQ